MKKNYDVLIIGAGLNGLAAAMILAKDGRKVRILEARSVIGGTAAEEEFHPGFKVPGTSHQSARLSELVARKLDLPQFDLEFATEEPAVLAPQKRDEGRGIFIHENAGKMGRELAGQDFQKYGEYKAFFEKIRPVVSELFFEAPPPILNPSFSDIYSLGKKALGLRMLGKKLMGEFMRIPPMCVADFLNEWFQSDLLKAAMSLPAISNTWTGPWSPGNATNLILHECIQTRTVRGGAAAVVRSLVKSAGAQGVEISVDSPVRRIVVDGGRASAVQLESGETLTADYIAASCDPKKVFLDLIDSRKLPYKLENRIQNVRSRGTTAKVNLAIKGRLKFACRPEAPVEYARTGSTLNDVEMSFDAVKYGQFSKKPVLEIFVPSVSDPSLAPFDHSVVSIIAHYAPYKLRAGWSDETRDAFGDNVLDVLESVCPGTRDSIVAGEVLTPPDLESRYGLSEGHLLQGEIALDQLLARPIPECAFYETPFKGLFLCGNGTHPGGVVTCGPGILAAETIIQRDKKVYSKAS